MTMGLVMRSLSIRRLVKMWSKICSWGRRAEHDTTNNERDVSSTTRPRDGSGVASGEEEGEEAPGRRVE
jgi:hypothetical protein